MFLLGIKGVFFDEKKKEKKKRRHKEINFCNVIFFAATRVPYQVQISIPFDRIKPLLIPTCNYFPLSFF